MSTIDPSYTVFIRLPFARGGFVDPPPVEWDAVKDKALWKVLSKASKNSDIDWSELAIKYQVSLAFLLQQAAWLYERQFIQVRAQIRKVGAVKGSSAPSPIPGSTSESAGGEAMRRTGSGGQSKEYASHAIGPRNPALLPSRRDSAVTIGSAKNDGAVPGTPIRAMAPPFSRTSSANTTTTSRHVLQAQTSPRLAHTNLKRRSFSPNPKPQPVTSAEPRARSPKPEPPSSPSSTSDDSSSDSEPPLQSRLLRRPARFTSNKMRQSRDGDEDDDEPAFMPFAAGTVDTTPHHDISATLRGDPRNIARRQPLQKRSSDLGVHSQTSDSSASSTAPTKRPEPLQGIHKQRITGPLSPRRTAELAGRSPGAKGKGREGSDGSPSMGSSFSDLDDASVTQSALEEALASNMQAGGGMASRVSTISQAFRSSGWRPG